MLRIDVDEWSAACLREELGALSRPSDDEHLLAHVLRAISSRRCRSTRWRASFASALIRIPRRVADQRVAVDDDLPATPTEADELSPAGPAEQEGPAVGRGSAG